MMPASGAQGAVDMLGAFVILANLVEPTADADERNAVFRVLFPGDPRGLPQRSTARLRSTVFTLTRGDVVPLTLFAERSN